MNNLNNKVIIITGASSGIGLACAEAFHNRGAKVALAARSADVIKAVADKLNGKTAGRAIAIPTDVAVEEDCKQLIQTVRNGFGRIDALINNAGLSMRANFAEVNLEVLKRLMEVNFWGAVYCTKYALPYLLESKGSVVAVSSVAGLHGMPGRTGYSASKYALQGFMDTVRIENLKKNLHVMVVVPGFVATNIRLTALVADGSAQGESPRKEEKMMSPEKLAEHIIRGLEKRRRRVAPSFEGRLTPVLKLLWPNLVDRLFYNHLKREPNAPL
ncbi:MAG: SDR family oxidoreductase [Prevotellaceae bacterium]|nr:SDR family oxidoreductase [Prevotellaceae bacterium]